MISDVTRKEMRNAVTSAAAYSKGRQRKQLQAAYDKLLDELSQHFFKEPCAGRMDFRQKMNALVLTGLDQNRVKVISAIRTMLANEDMLFNRDYVDSEDNVAKFLTVHVRHVLAGT